MTGRRLAYAALILAMVLGTEPTLSQASQTGSAALPRLVIDSLPPTVRAGLERAYEAARAHPRDPSIVGRLGMILHAYEQYRSADACYRIARQLDARSISWAYLSGVVQAELGEHGAATALLRQALDIDPDYLPARIRLADTLMRAGDLQASHDEYEMLVRNLPELALAHYGLGRVSSMRGNSKAAADHYLRAVDAAPRFGPAHYALALAYRDMGLVDRAQPHLEAYRQLGAHRPVLPDRLLEQVRSMRETARDLLEEAARLDNSGRLDESIALQLKALEADPATAQAHVNLIALYGRTGQPDKAEMHYHAAVKLESSLAEAHYNYGVLLASSRRYDEAVDIFRKVLEIDPFHASAHNNLGALLAQRGELAPAATHYRQALANDPQHRTARFSLGRVLMMLGRPREAIDHFQRVLFPEDADTPRYMYSLANAYFAAGDVPKAREYGQDALRRAERLGQTELAAMIRNELQKMKAGRR